MFRPMFRFTIRDVLWLMVVVGLGFGWYLDREAMRQKPQREIQFQLLRTLVERQERQIQEDWERIDSLGAIVDELRAAPDFPELPPGYRWKRTIAGKVPTREPRPTQIMEQEPSGFSIIADPPRAAVARPTFFDP